MRACLIQYDCADHALRNPEPVRSVCGELRPHPEVLLGPSSNPHPLAPLNGLPSAGHLMSFDSRRICIKPSAWHGRRCRRRSRAWLPGRGDRRAAEVTLGHDRQPAVVTSRRVRGVVPTEVRRMCQVFRERRSRRWFDSPTCSSALRRHALTSLAYALAKCFPRALNARCFHCLY